MRVQSFHLSTQGASHIKKNKECQDASESYFDENCAIAIVCDGHGGDDYVRSANGSAFACAAAKNSILALALLIISETSEIAQSTVYIMLAAAAVIAIITIYNDIRLAGLWWGVLALFLQILFSLCFVIFIFCALVGLAMKKIFNIRNSLITSVFDGLGLKGEMALLLYFLHP